MAAFSDGSAPYEAQVRELIERVESARSDASRLAAELARQEEALQSLGGRLKAVLDESTVHLSAAAMRSTELEHVRHKAAMLLTAIEEDTRKANSESAFAFNAKTNAEEHAKAVAQIKGTVEATFAGLGIIQAQITDLAAAISTLKVSAENDCKATSEAKLVATRDAATVSAAAERVAAVMPAIDAGSKDANAISVAKDAAESSLTAIQALQTQLSETTAKATSDGALLAKSEAEAKALVTSMSDANLIAQSAVERVGGYETALGKQQLAFDAMHAKLEGLLPHATSAGLASAFHIQRERFAKPQPYWLGLFVATIGLLLLSTAIGLSDASGSWETIVRHLVNRLPLVVPLVWLAIYAGHHYNMALRMEEDYAFKEALSTAFEGYKREMQEVPLPANATANPLVTLCENVLRALAERPGRIYEGGKADVVTPLTQIEAIVSRALGTAAKEPPKS